MMTRQKNPAYKSSKEGWILRFLVLGNIGGIRYKGDIKYNHAFGKYSGSGAVIFTPISSISTLYACKNNSLCIEFLLYFLSPKIGACKASAQWTRS